MRPPSSPRRSDGGLARLDRGVRGIRCNAIPKDYHRGHRGKPEGAPVRITDEYNPTAEARRAQRKPLERNPTGQNDLPEPTQKTLWLKRWWPAIAWAVVISLFSTHAFTSENTGRYIIPALHWFLPHSPMATLAAIHHYIRKTGHLTEYFILSLLLLRGIRSERKGMRLSWAFAAIGLVLCYASLDEFHQRFVPGRTPAVSDVMLDTCGGVIAQLVVGVAAIWKRRERNSAEVRERA